MNPREFRYDPRRHDITMLASGKQGVIGVIREREIPDGQKKRKNANANQPNKKNLPVVFKLSNMYGFIGTHESQIFEALEPLHAYCPLFTRGYGLREDLPVNSNVESDNPLAEASIAADVVFFEFIDNSHKLVQYAKRPPSEIPDNVIASQVLLVLAGIRLAHSSCKFTHYDLHTDNILVQPCSPKDVYLFRDTRMETPVSYLVPTYGHLPRIIDYGFSYAETLTHITSPLGFMNNGFTSYRPDAFADFRILLLSTLDDCIRDRPGSKLTSNLYNFVHKVYGRQNVEWESGWFLDKFKSTSEFLQYMFQGITKKSATFDEVDVYIYDMFQALIPLSEFTDLYPDKPKSFLVSEMKTALKTFLGEFHKLEADFHNNAQTGLYLVRCILLAASSVREEYYSKDETDESAATRNFKNQLFDSLRPIKKFYTPNINHKKLLVSTFVITEIVQSILYRETQYREKYINAQNGTIGLSASELFFVTYAHLIPPEFQIEAGMRVIYMDEENKCMKQAVITPDLETEVKQLSERGQQAERVRQYVLSTSIPTEYVHVHPPTPNQDPLEQWSDTDSDASAATEDFEWRDADVDVDVELRPRTIESYLDL